MPSIIYECQIYCNTEQKFVTGYGAELPVACYNNTEHEVNPNSMSIISEFSPTAVTIAEEEPISDTGGHYQMESFTFVAAANTVTTHSVSFPFNISLLTCTLQADAGMISDSVDFCISPDTTIGTLTTTHNASSTVLHVSATVLQNAYTGLYASVTNGETVNQLGRIVSVDRLASTVTVETPTAYTFNIGSAFRVTRYFAKNYRLACTGIHAFGVNKTGSSFLRKTLTGVCVYHNTGAEKTVTFTCEYLY